MFSIPGNCDSVSSLLGDCSYGTRKTYRVTNAPLGDSIDCPGSLLKGSTKRLEM